jgi:hypothetical protein
MSAVEIPLRGGLIALVDEVDAELVAGYRWRAVKIKHCFYARTQLREPGWPCVYMHRLLLAVPRGVCVDHINHDGLDNQRANLRVCSKAQNLANARKRISPRGTHSDFKGIIFIGRLQKWRAQISFQKVRRYLGHYSSEVEAARAYDRAARETFGDFACVNFPEEA